MSHPLCVSGAGTPPLVSVVTVSLNAANTIEHTLQSVARQLAAFSIEHLCIDGGSTDGTREIIERFAQNNRAVRWIFEPDKGLFDAMNKGIGAARGDYVLFLNADDFLVGPDSVAAAFSRVQWQHASDRPDMIMGDVIMGRPNHFGMWRMRYVPRWLPRLPGIGAHPPHQGNFVKRSLLEKAGGFDTSQRLAADTTLFYQLINEYAPSMHVSRTVVSFMRMGGASNSGLSAHSKGNKETYRFLRRYKSPAGSMLAVAVKLAQKIFEYRIGAPKTAFRA